MQNTERGARPPPEKVKSVHAPARVGFCCAEYRFIRQFGLDSMPTCPIVLAGAQ
jgi:hypothetical protein